MFRFLVGIIILLFLVGIIYVIIRTHKISFIQRLSAKHKILSWIISLIPLCAVACFSIINVFATIIVFFHLVVIWILCDIIGLILKKILRFKPKRYYAGLTAIVLTTIYLSYGWISAHHVFQTDYNLSTSKNLGQQNLRIVTIADSHIGITLDSEKFANEMERVSNTNPDVVIIAGDYVDDDTLKVDMEKCCEALGNIKSKYGVYFAFGNHDKGYFQYRDFTSDDLRQELLKNNVNILEDEAKLIDNQFYIIGRQDKQIQNRADINTLTKDLDKDKYKILIDHEPNDYDNEAGYVDLVLSGHTHGGHIFPAGYIGLAIKANDRVYGHENRNGTDFIVTSGISGWAIPFKTGTISEFIVTDISTANN